MGAGRRHRPRRAPARRRPIPRQPPSLLAGKSFGVFRERLRNQTGQGSRRAGARHLAIQSLLLSWPRKTVSALANRG